MIQLPGQEPTRADLAKRQLLLMKRNWAVQPARVQNFERGPEVSSRLKRRYWATPRHSYAIAISSGLHLGYSNREFRLPCQFRPKSSDGPVRAGGCSTLGPKSDSTRSQDGVRSQFNGKQQRCSAIEKKLPSHQNTQAFGRC